MQGTVTTGENNAAAFVPVIADIVIEQLGFSPFAGTFNLDGVSDSDVLPEQHIDDPSLGMDNCQGVMLRPCAIVGVRGAVIRPIVEGYPETKTELIAPVRLRSLFDVADGSVLTITQADDLTAPDGPQVNAAALDEFSAVVFDLDQTLLTLDVEWMDVKSDLESLLGDHLSGPIEEGMDTDLQTIARKNDLWDSYMSLLADYEIEGARNADPLPLLEILPSLDCPVGVCTKNAATAAERALEQFGVGHAVDVIVARETMDEQKPHPKPLQHCVEALDCRPGETVFVGDDPTDREAASRAGTSYLHPNRFDIAR